MIDISTIMDNQQLENLLSSLGLNSKSTDTTGPTVPPSRIVNASLNALEGDVGVSVEGDEIHIFFYDHIDAFLYRWWATYSGEVVEALLRDAIITASTCTAVETRIKEMSRATELNYLLASFLGEHVLKHRLGWLWQGWMKLKGVDDIIGTIFVPKKGLRQEPKGSEELDTVPELVIEVVHPNLQYQWSDRHKILSQLFGIGVKRVWIIMAQDHALLVYHSASDATRLTQEHTLQGEYSLQGFSFPLSRLFESDHNVVRGYPLVRIRPRGLIG